MAVFCVCCGAGITQKAEACPVAVSLGTECCRKVYSISKALARTPYKKP